MQPERFMACVPQTSPIASIFSHRVAAVDSQSIYIADATTVQKATLSKEPTFRKVLMHVNSDKNAKIESVTARSVNGDVVLAVVDDTGLISVSRHDDDSAIVEQIQPAPSISKDAGWAGVDFQPQQPNKVVSARWSQRNLSIFDQGKLIRSVYFSHPVTQFCFISPSRLLFGPLIAIAEGPQLSIWDERVSDYNGVVQRLGPSSSSTLFAVASSSNHVAVAGADRSVTVYDPRKWTSILGSWSSSLKYDVGWLAFNEEDDRYCYAGSTTDSEIGCGPWDSSLSRTSRMEGSSFRGDGRWLGLAKVDDNDTVLGMTASGSLYRFSNFLSSFQQLARDFSSSSDLANKRTATDDDSEPMII